MPHMGRPRVLVVEDDLMLGTLMAELLGNLGYDVCPVETTEAGAVSAAAWHKPDLMIVDLQLADGSGLSAMARIGQTNPVPHVFMSGELVQAAMPGTISLRKPFRESDLVRAIGQALGAGVVDGRIVE